MLPSSHKILEDDQLDKKLDKYYEYKASFWGKIENKWNEILGYKIKDFKKGVKNIFRWIPIIYQDRDWDSCAIFKILQTKIKFVAEHHEGMKHYVGWEREVELMKLCLKLIDYIQDEHYNEIFYDKLKNKYGKSEFKFTPIPGTDRSQMDILHENVQNSMYTEKEYEVDFHKWCNEANKKQDKARKLLFKILYERVMKWWT